MLGCATGFRKRSPLPSSLRSYLASSLAALVQLPPSYLHHLSPLQLHPKPTTPLFFKTEVSSSSSIKNHSKRGKKQDKDTSSLPSASLPHYQLPSTTLISSSPQPYPTTSQTNHPSFFQDRSFLIFFNQIPPKKRKKKDEKPPRKPHINSSSVFFSQFVSIDNWVLSRTYSKINPMQILAKESKIPI